MTESPALGEKMNGRGKKREEKERTYMFTKHVIIRIFDFMKVVFIQLSNETGKI